MKDSHADRFLREVAELARQIDSDQIDRMAAILAGLRGRGGRLFIIGVGGGAGHASHAVNDFRKLCGIDAISPLDNVSELTARINDDGWDRCLVDSLRTSRMGSADALLVFSVGGGSTVSGLSLNIVAAVEHARAVGAPVLGIVGRRDGATATLGDCVIVLDRSPAELLTPLVEGFQAVLWHALVSHPQLCLKQGTWETLTASSRPAPSGQPNQINAGALRIKLFADGADRDQILKLAGDPMISGFTTNPTLMRASGVTDYRAFAQDLLAHVTDRPISFEVLADEHDAMYRQAKEIASWGPNVYVKVPITNTRRESSLGVVRRLSLEGIRVNVTAVFTIEQVETAARALTDGAPSVISVFAGRIADTGRDPVPYMARAVQLAANAPATELLWASPREILNLYQADAIGCHIITMTPDLLARVRLRNKDLEEYSEETVKMFYNDAARAGYSL